MWGDDWLSEVRGAWKGSVTAGHSGDVCTPIITPLADRTR